LLFRILSLLNLVANRTQVIANGAVSISDDHLFAELEHGQILFLFCRKIFIFAKFLNTFETGL